ncbi:MAG TPA: hypothetical protein VM840_03450 [Actinomycetota bacterium]|nr:hypothetical protein [Actinomycetota bacterium]
MSRDVFRRYPALAYLVGAGMLAVLLPSALTLPNSGPPTLAEYAPVTGEGEGTGDVSALGQAGSGGLGFGSGRGRRDAPDQVTDPSDGIAQTRPGNKRCAGTPPRQTEDPLSPPCIGFFNGNNGGATARGVTGSEVRVFVETETSDSNRGRIVDCGDPPAQDETPQDLVCKAYMTYFNERYQTYGRRVRLYSVHDLRVPDIEGREPFAIATMGVEVQAGRRGIVSVGYNSIRRQNYQAASPHLFGFRADHVDHYRIGASYVCNELAGRPAVHSGNVADRSKPRRFAIWHDDTDGEQRDLLVRHLNDLCGLEVTHFAARPNDPGAPGRFRSDDVTSVIALFQGQSAVTPTTLATNQGWFPEWVVLGDTGGRGLDTNFYARTANQASWANAFGITFDYRRDSIPEQHWYRAYREGCPDCPDFTAAQSGGSNAPYAYDMLTMLFYGIQAAGPRLTVANLDRGLHAIPQSSSTGPYRPAAYFEPGGYTYLKDAARIWWDPSGQPPGSPGSGCWRLPEEGRRHRAGEWRSDDGRVKGQGPCQGDSFR